MSKELDTCKIKEIIELAEIIIESQSFEYNNFRQARNLINLSSYFCDYDRLTLLIYSHNLNHDEYRYFVKYLKRRLNDNHFSKEEIKLRKELISLFHFFESKNEFYDSIFKKEVRPDFLIFDGKMKIGVEITELTTPKDKIADSISRNYLGQGLTKEDIETDIKIKHGSNANGIEIMSINDQLAIGGPIKNIGRIKQYFAERIIDKYTKYQSMINKFDEFIILCDAIEGIEITNAFDTIDVFKELESYFILNDVTIAIIYMDNNDYSYKCKMQRF